jgi:hypothetical protein
MISAMTSIYDEIGKTYSCKRQADPRISLAIDQALNGCTSILNVGAGRSGTRRSPPVSRVARDRVVYLTIDPEVCARFRLFEYLPSLWD